MADLIERLRAGVADNPKLEVVWVQNMRAFIDTDMFRSFPDWRQIFRAEFDAMLGAAAEAADEIERLTAELASARALLAQYEQAPVVGERQRLETKAQQLHGRIVGIEGMPDGALRTLAGGIACPEPSK